MKLKTIATAFAAVALAASPVLVQAETVERQGAKIGKSEELAPALAILLGFAVASAVVVGAVVIADNSPASP